MFTDEIFEECPICKKHTFRWLQYNNCECTNCGWWPHSIPWDIEDYEDDIKKYNEKNKK